MSDIQGDKKTLSILESMGAKFQYVQDERILRILKSGELKGIEIDINDVIDSITILAVLGTFARGQTLIKNGAIARKKECDRIFAISTELKKMGASIEELPDGLNIKQSRLLGTTVESYDDHRTAMSFFSFSERNS